MVREPAAGAFDEVVAPDESIQAAIDRCREGGSILLQPGTYEPSETLLIAREVHVFGRGLARLRADKGDGVASTASAATLDGLVIERAQASEKKFIGVAIEKGGLRLQNTVVTGAFKCGVAVSGGADPVIVSSRWVNCHPEGGHFYFFLVCA